MITPNTEVCLVILGLESMAGLCSSAFIIFYLLLTSFKERRVTPCNCILLSLSISNANLIIFLSVFSLVIFVWPWLFNVPKVFYAVYSLTLCSNCSSAWITSILCFFYFIKIRHFQPGFFARMKRKIDTTVPWLILTVLFVSMFVSYLSVLIYDLGLPKNSTKFIGSVTFKHYQLRINSMKPFIIINFPAYMISLASTFASAWFLKQQRSARNSGSTKVKDYQNAVHIMICLVPFHALICILFVLNILQIFAIKSWGYWLCTMVTFSVTAVQSGLIISGNPKLREAWECFFAFRNLLNHQDG